MVQAFQHLPCDPLDDGRLDAAADEKKKRIVYQLGQGEFHDHNCNSVDETEGAGGKSPVGKTFVLD